MGAVYIYNKDISIKIHNLCWDIKIFVKQPISANKHIYFYLDM